MRHLAAASTPLIGLLPIYMEQLVSSLTMLRDGIFQVRFYVNEYFLFPMPAESNWFRV